MMSFWDTRDDTGHIHYNEKIIGECVLKVQTSPWWVYINDQKLIKEGKA